VVTVAVVVDVRVVRVKFPIVILEVEVKIPVGGGGTYTSLANTNKSNFGSVTFTEFCVELTTTVKTSFWISNRMRWLLLGVA